MLLIIDAIALSTGGVSNGKDAVELMMAGASAVGVGSVTYIRGKQCFSEITKEIEEWMIQNNVKKLDEIIGKAHK